MPRIRVALLVLLSVMVTAEAAPPVSAPQNPNITFRPGAPGKPPVRVIMSRPQPVVPPPATAPSSGDPMIDALNKQRQDMQKAYSQLNALNPMSAEYGKEAPAGVAASTGPLAEMQKLLSSPAVQSYLKLFQSKAFSDGANAIVNHPNRMILLWAELGTLLFMMFFRAWRFSRVNHWIRKLWVNCYTLVLGWCLGVVAVPVAVLGTPYANVLQGLIETVLKK